jgi:flagellin
LSEFVWRQGRCPFIDEQVITKEAIMAVVNTNIGASVAQAALAKNARDLNTAMTELSTGKQINSAADNASGLAISNRMTSQINGLGAAIKNANDAISMVNTGEGALEEITDMLQRMRELAVTAATGTATAEDRDYLDAEYQKLIAEIDRVAENTQWNGSDIIDGTAGSSGTVTFQVGANASQSITVAFGDMTDASGATMASVATGDVDTASAAGTAIGVLDTAIEAVSNQRAVFGAASNQLEHAVDNLTNVKINAEASRSRILDTDYAESTAELARTQIIQQAGTAMLAQANQLPQTVLALLQ